ncbi:unnamed protein product [Diatraea saccharalis]|uniref:TIL domain-containing protein n=1 Tax=Diatraea saccharalis TaxID=40085 RepID=A0A9N9R0N1_9NEOP|nr:unnamed protein product [Diatraea saccharalis]
MSSSVFSLCLVAVLINLVYAGAVTDERKPFDCPENEYYDFCALRVCYKKCSDLKYTPPCPSITPDCFHPACLCKEGHLRNKDGVCVTTRQCYSDIHNNKI